jgi:hypothetical protein
MLFKALLIEIYSEGASLPPVQKIFQFLSTSKMRDGIKTSTNTTMRFIGEYNDIRGRVFKIRIEKTSESEQE